MVGLALLCGTWFNLFGQTGLIALIALFLAGQGLTNPNANALSLAPFSRHVGSAASLGGSFRMGMGGVASGLVSFFHNGTAMPMVGVMVGCTMLGFAILLVVKTRIRSSGQDSDVNGDTALI